MSSHVNIALEALETLGALDGVANCTLSLSWSPYSAQITSPTVKSSVPLESLSSLKILWSESVSSFSKLCSISSSNEHFLLTAVIETVCYFNETKLLILQCINSLFKNEGDVIHHFKAKDLSYVSIAITFVSNFISLLERRIIPPVQLEVAKRKPRFREERKKMKK
jgi:hypothetical protein